LRIRRGDEIWKILKLNLLHHLTNH
jgi:hypothetical protein